MCAHPSAHDSDSKYIVDGGAGLRFDLRSAHAATKVFERLARALLQQIESSTCENAFGVCEIDRGAVLGHGGGMSIALRGRGGRHVNTWAGRLVPGTKRTTPIRRPISLPF